MRMGETCIASARDNDSLTSDILVEELGREAGVGFEMFSFHGSG